MLAYIARRLVQAAAVLLAVAFMAFLLFQYVGDPVASLAGPDATPQQRDRLRSELGIDRSFVVQFGRYASHAVRGDFGISLRHGRAVSALLAERLPATMELAVTAAALSFAVGIPLGAWGALNRGRISGAIATGVSLLGVSLPTFLVGILMILVFSVQLHWLPSYGRGDVTAIGSWSTGLLSLDGLRHLILPAFTLALFQVGLIARLVRAELLDVLQSNYIRFARARGLSEVTIHFRHALRNVLMPVLTVGGLQFGSLIAFSIITETVFQWPGMGLLFIQAVTFADIPLMAGYLCVVALMFVAINFVVDMLYLAVDPRVRLTAA